MYSDVLAKVIANPEAMARLGKNHQPGKFKAYAYKGGLNVDNTSGAIPKVTFNKYGLQLMFQLTGFDQSAMISAEVSDTSAPPPSVFTSKNFHSMARGGNLEVQCLLFRSEPLSFFAVH